VGAVRYYNAMLRKVPSPLCLRHSPLFTLDLFAPPVTDNNAAGGQTYHENVRGSPARSGSLSLSLFLLVFSGSMRRAYEF
jgi:hypothetical protein